MRKILAIGIGTGNPDHLTVQAIQALRRVDVVFLLDKGSSKADLGPVRREICTRYIESGKYRLVELPDSERDASVSSYTERVEDWHERRVERFECTLEAALPEAGCGAFLVWGDPSLYDSTLRILDALQRRGRLRFEYEVIPGISSPQVLAARHKIVLNRIGGAVQITTGRRLAAGWPNDAQDVVVMLDAECSFRTLPAEDLEIYWGAYLGTEHELLIRGPLAECQDEIVAARARARARHGWIMDTYLLRRTSPSRISDSPPGPSLPQPAAGGIVAASSPGERT